jgi:hypothetical protein
MASKLNFPWIVNCKSNMAVPSMLRGSSGISKYLGNSPLQMTDASGKIVNETTFAALHSKWFTQQNYSDCVVHRAMTNSCNIGGLLIPVIANYANCSNQHVECLLDRHRCYEVPVWEWIILGSKGLQVARHVDMLHTDSWNYLVEGKKVWNFWERQSDKNASPCLQLYQEPGDLVWIPAGMPHSVQYDAPSVAYSKNLVLQSNVSAVTACVTRATSRQSAVLLALGEIYASNV